MEEQNEKNNFGRFPLAESHRLEQGQGKRPYLRRDAQNCQHQPQAEQAQGRAIHRPDL